MNGPADHVAGLGLSHQAFPAPDHRDAGAGSVLAELSSSGTAESPDIETSSDDYATRFQGEVGRYLLDVQEGGVFALIEGCPIEPGATVLDVGGGHAQLAPPLAAAGYKVTVAGSDPICARRLQADERAGPVEFVACDLLRMPFADREFRAVICIRLMAHMPDWRALVAELCRVADQAVIIDYPVYSSLNALTLLAFPLKRLIERNTRTYTTFFERELCSAFAAHGFQHRSEWRQFVLPMVLHRVLPRSTLPRRLERVFRAIGLTRLIGNPALTRFERR